MRTAELLCKRADLWKVADMMKDWDESLFHHSLTVADLTCEVARRLGCDEKQIEHLQMGAFLHDVGKICWPRYLVSKRNLSPDDVRMIRDHPRYGEAYAEEYVRNVNPDVLRIIREHHERLDGSGYPDGLKDGAISFLSRIVAAVECFAALTEPRQYREKQFTVEEALRIAADDGFDPTVLKIIGGLFGKKVAQIASR
ncbi:MAG: hypothetical protein PWQ39_160 [Thermacetogenium sp.]|nr:hypothetical protein [Thermacetogenium sp.]